MTVEVTRNDAMSRYEARVDGALAGVAEYRLTDDVVVFTHTEVDPAFEGQGVASTLARTALDEIRDAGARRVLPLCPFVSGWIARHDEYRSLVARATSPSPVD